ncbi:MAG: hypothetical protein A3B29_02930 [Candidatus Sungbacteria bacterium RIFCSPLOWO2_01_FULL_51_34]|uniref:SpaA-like prealbumin fold domain-containing protein n=1 Tax=Candidatus Sungbacteria bacterium RIFCSPHIGHO2_02_FULL_51_29 TaxID=1802273 RepID=A0A1G2KUI6_9BACT|nr:MAG: hypothetical protein A3C16_02765 [Candidatus Sungbacteria bacterium RIFCSPHIGHO2_02_FULL_51_29]OHA05615.1 MAG: hypothetical protein A3B29_02930 [Candidatus Sungbacteria bacterium RIFCSPLOWO2_01_FULL_51_34]
MSIFTPSRAFGISTAIVFAAVQAVQFVPLMTLAIGNPFITINTVNGAEAPATCIEASSITLIGSGMGSAPPGAIQDYDVRVDWDDGDVDNGGADGISTVFTPASGAGSFSYTYNASHTYLTNGTYIVTAYLYREIPTGGDPETNIPSAAIRLCVTIPTMGTIKVVKYVINDNGGTRAISDFPLFVNQTSVAHNAINTFSPGSYAVSEQNQSGYVATFSGDCDSGGVLLLHAGDHLVCTITNNDAVSRLTLYKHVINDGGGTKQVSDFLLSVDGVHVTSGQAVAVSAGTHAASEVSASGYQASAWSGDCASDGTVVLLPGEDKECHITNNDIAITQTCITCERDAGGNPVTVVVDENVIVNFNPVIPVCSGDADLCSLFTYSKTGATPDTWKAIFDLGGKALRVVSGNTITVKSVGIGNNQKTPGISIMSTCTVMVEYGANIFVTSLNQKAGDILIRANGAVGVNGIVRNQVAGTNGLPGKVTVASMCGNVTEGATGLIQVLGVDPGGNDINLLACGSGDVTTNGLVMSRAKAHGTGSRPNINVAAFDGAVTINANIAHPLFDEYNYGGARYDLWGGLLSWVTHNMNPGTVKVQAKKQITVNGHGTDPTAPARHSFGAIAAYAGTSGQRGGVVDIRSLDSTIMGSDRAFDVAGRYNGGANPAKIALRAAANIILQRLGANANFGPVVNASAGGGGSSGGVNEIRSYQGGITAGTNAVVSADATGTGSVDGQNILTSCAGLTLGGTVVPADGVSGDNSGTCGTLHPAPHFQSCAIDFGLLAN